MACLVSGSRLRCSLYGSVQVRCPARPRITSEAGSRAARDETFTTSATAASAAGPAYAKVSLISAPNHLFIRLKLSLLREAASRNESATAAIDCVAGL